MSETTQSENQDPCSTFNHDYKEEYYGHRCTKCGLFFAHGCAPWDDDDENYCDDEDDEAWDDDDDDFFDCGMMADGTCSQAGSEWCEFECPNRS